MGALPKSSVTDRRLKNERGAALLLSLWALFLLSAMVISWALEINSRVLLSGNANRALEAEAMACSGAEIALHPAVKPGSPLLRGGMGGKKFDARITGEAGRMNLNFLLAGENPVKLELLRKYLEIKGVDLNERDHMIDCLLDWVDADNLEHLNGAEEGPGYKPPNKPLAKIEEVRKVRGWEEFTSTADWDADFTLDTASGLIEPVWASRDVLLSLPGMTEPFVDQFLALRRGPDGIEGTEDDAVFKNLDEVLVALGYASQQVKQQLSGLIGFGDPTIRVVSVGQSGEVTRTVRMVVRKAGNAIQLRSWKEL
ncbi:MAG: ral secretion pathway protein [Verrucomicrobiota bacterium]|jgi:hypothetical protein